MHKHEQQGIILKVYSVPGTVLYILYTLPQLILLIATKKYCFSHLQMGKLSGQIVCPRSLWQCVKNWKQSKCSIIGE